MRVKEETSIIVIPEGVPARELIVNFQKKVEKEARKLQLDKRSMGENPKVTAWLGNALTGVAPLIPDEETFRLIQAFHHIHRVFTCYIQLLRISELLKVPDLPYRPMGANSLGLHGQNNLVAGLAYFAEAQNEWAVYQEERQALESQKPGFSEKGTLAAAELWKRPRIVTGVIAEAEWLRDGSQPRTITEMVATVLAEMERKPDLFSLPRFQIPNQKTVRMWVKAKAVPGLSRPGRRKK